MSDGTALLCFVVALCCFLRILALAQERNELRIENAVLKERLTHLETSEPKP